MGTLTRTVIEPARPWPRIDWQELWAYRGLFRLLVWRDLRVRYAQTALGAAWAVLQPLLAMLVFTMIFGRFARIPSDGAPYAAFSLVGLVAWTYFSTALAGASGSLVTSSGLITKVYFPRLIVPLAPVLAGVVDFGINVVVLLVILLLVGIVPRVEALALAPLLVGIMMLAASGVGCWLTALHIRYRDVKYVVPFLLQIWMYASPVAYPTSIVPPALRPVYALNPMVGVIEGFRSVLLGSHVVAWPMIVLSLAVSAAVFATGIAYFQHTERSFADVA